jgi:4-hydroxy-3-polyprenylbenzoate decarboxylase
MYKDLRDFIDLVDKLQALRRIDGADPQFEIGAITEVAAGRPGGPALLFDDIKGFPRGFRILTNAVTSAPRAALALGLDPSMRPLDALKAWMEKRKSLKPHAPVTAEQPGRDRSQQISRRRAQLYGADRGGRGRGCRLVAWR